ncbi:MAG: hypothetical protein ACOYLG_08335 [Chitinophagaceae bacterium]|jgi:hypothetical protein
MLKSLLSIFEIGNVIGYYGCWLFIIIMFVGLVFVMKNYLKDN